MSKPEIKAESPILIEIFEEMMRRGISNLTMSDMSGLGTELISSYRSGRGKPNLKNLERMVDALDLRLRLGSK